jgi:hypothetical protein
MHDELEQQDDSGCRQDDAIRDDAAFDVDRREDDENSGEDRRDERLAAEAEPEKAKRCDQADAGRSPGCASG